MGADAPRPKYVIANADEMEPGTFKDRYLMEGNPHQLIDGLILAAYANQADVAFIFIRGEYKLAQERLARAIAEAYSAGYLGKDILSSGYTLEMYLHISAGRYMCGEETGLLNALEGKRANPRAKPPFPQVSGLWGKPTIVNNVETLANVPHIIEKGAAWFQGLSRTKDAGTKLYGASGKVKRPGLWELPMGTTMREILEEHAGGMRDGVALSRRASRRRLHRFSGGRASRRAHGLHGSTKGGSRLGTGTMIVLDDQTCPVGMTSNLIHFFAQESCGWCTPCWSGLNWATRILEAMEEGHGKPGDLEKLSFQTKFWSPGQTFCALAPGAAEPCRAR